MRAGTPVRALTLAGEENLAPLSGYLWQQRIAHRIFEERGEQVLEVASAEAAEEVRAIYAAWRAGEFKLTPIQDARARPAKWAMLQFPALLALLAFTLICFPITWPLDRGELGVLLPWFTIVPMTLQDGELVNASLRDTLMAGEIWRLVTPALLHFSFAHLAFNVALLVEFGRRVERTLGAGMFVGAAIVIAGVSNVAQYALGGSVLFGGLSGVVYGLFGLIVVRGRMEPGKDVWQLRPGFIVMVMLFLVVMSTGVTESFGLNIANGAHWGGLVVGCLLALVPFAKTRA